MKEKKHGTSDVQISTIVHLTPVIFRVYCPVAKGPGNTDALGLP
jgi:hypothetical protein